MAAIRALNVITNSFKVDEYSGWLIFSLDTFITIVVKFGSDYSCYKVSKTNFQFMLHADFVQTLWLIIPSTQGAKLRLLNHLNVEATFEISFTTLNQR